MPVRLFPTGLFTVPFASRLCHDGAHASAVLSLMICARRTRLSVGAKQCGQTSSQSGRRTDLDRGVGVVLCTGGILDGVLLVGEKQQPVRGDHRGRRVGWARGHKWGVEVPVFVATI